MLKLERDTPPFTGVIVLEVPQGTALAVARFNACATENRIKHLPGFAGAFFAVNDRDDRVLEFVRWTSAAAFGAIQPDWRYYEHVRAVEKVARVAHLSFSTSVRHLSAVPGLAVRREDRISFALHAPVEASRAPGGSAPSGDCIEHSGTDLKGRDTMSVLRLERGGHGSSAQALEAPELLDCFTVIEAIDSPEPHEVCDALFRIK